MKSSAFDAEMLPDPESGETRAFQEFRRWFSDEIRESDQRFGPSGIADLLENLVEDAIPVEPVALPH